MSFSNATTEDGVYRDIGKDSGRRGESETEELVGSFAGISQSWAIQCYAILSYADPYLVQRYYISACCGIRPNRDRHQSK